jgi:outer membrane protein TolC
VELSEYERATGSRDDIRASLNLEIPIYQGSHKRLAQSAAELEVEKARARLQLIQDTVHQQLFDLLQALEVTRLEKNAARTRETYRDLYLDRSRALYEMEVRTDLGDAQAKLLEATWHSARADFTTTVTWAKLDALLGRPVFPNEANSAQ